MIFFFFFFLVSCELIKVTDKGKSVCVRVWLDSYVYFRNGRNVWKIIERSYESYYMIPKGERQVLRSEKAATKIIGRKVCEPDWHWIRSQSSGEMRLAFLWFSVCWTCGRVFELEVRGSVVCSRGQAVVFSVTINRGIKMTFLHDSCCFLCANCVWKDGRRRLSVSNSKDRFNVSLGITTTAQGWQVSKCFQYYG